MAGRGCSAGIRRRRDSELSMERIAGTDFPHGLLLTDLYQLNMVDSYLREGLTDTAVFEFFVRKLPGTRNFLIAAGLEQVLDFLESARLSEAEMAWLRDCGRFSGILIDYLGDFRFSGDVDAMPEGTIFFSDEPILRVTAPLPAAQLMETRLINFLQYQTMIASKAARMLLAAPGKALVDFGLRRAHSGEAGLLAARAAFIAGFAGTATVPAEAAFGVPIFGTMAHSYILAHDSEVEAFEAFARAHPGQTTFLIDTYDTERAARRLVELAPKLKAAGIPVGGVRLDSGDLAAHAFAMREILDAGDLTETRIFASGGLDEYALAALTASGAPINVYGVGTSLVTSDDAPSLDCAYKLQSYAGTPKRKRSEGKETWPGAKQVYRRTDSAGVMAGDVLTTVDDASQAGEALIRPMMRQGRRVAPPPRLAASQAHAAEQLARLPKRLRALEPAPPYEAAVSDRLQQLARKADNLADDLARGGRD